MSKVLIEEKIQWRLAFQVKMLDGQTMEQTIILDSLDKVRRKLKQTGSFATPISLEKMTRYIFTENEQIQGEEVSIVL